MDVRPEMIDRATKLIESAGFKACTAHCAIEAKPPVEWNKGRASIYILRTAFGVDWSERVRIIYVGDDATDEDAMKVGLRWVVDSVLWKSDESLFFLADFEGNGGDFPSDVVPHYPDVGGETFAQHGFRADDAQVGRATPQQEQQAAQ